MDNKDIIKITITSGSEKPYYLTKHGMSSKGAFIRIGTASEPLSPKMIEELFMKRVRTTIGSISSPYQDLTFEQLKNYYNERGLTLNDNFLRSLELVTEDDMFNYAAYLLSDNNGCSIKVAKYSGSDRYDLIENEEYGYCSIIKATKSVLDKMKLENRTFAKITFDGRIETKLLNPTALREAVSNAIVHNDYTSEVPPKFEFFSDRLEITSKGGIPLGLTKEEFLFGISQPVN